MRYQEAITIGKVKLYENFFATLYIGNGNCKSSQGGR
jgi:hypothetical protein